MIYFVFQGKTAFIDQDKKHMKNLKDQVIMMTMARSKKTSMHGPGSNECGQTKGIRQRAPLDGMGTSTQFISLKYSYHLLDNHSLHHSARNPEQPLTKENEEILNILKVMSHDVRGPLTTLGAGLKLLKKGIYGKMDQAVSDEIGRLFILVEGLMGTLEDFLGRAFSINSGLEMSQESLHLSQDVLQPVLLEFTREMRSYHILVEKDLQPVPGCEPFIFGDKFWLKAIFRNLIRNAIKYGGKGCKIKIGFKGLGSQFRMNVHNTGKPVPKEFHNQLFTKFGRISPKKNGNSEGMGLGLFLVKQIIERHGGNIWYEAERDGSNFIFTLPKIQPLPPPQPSQ